MKTSSIHVLIISIIIPIVAEAQWTYLGLLNNPVNEFKIDDGWLYAATNNGLFKKQLGNSDTTWSLMGFEETRIFDFIIFSKDSILLCKNINSTPDDTVSLFITYDGGNSWNDFQNGFGVDINSKRCKSMEKGSPGTGAIFARTGSCVARSQDNGVSWELVHGQWDNTSSTSINLFNFYSNGNCWAGGLTGYFQPYLLKSEDFGTSWEFIGPSSFGDNYTVCLLQSIYNADEILIGSSGDMLKSYDGGYTWNISFDFSSDLFFSDLKFSTVEDSLIYLVGNKVNTSLNPNVLVLYGSEDFGETWEPMDSLELPPDQIAVHLEILNEDESEKLFFATSSGVFMFNLPVGINERIVDDPANSGFIYPNPFHSKASIKLYNTKQGDKTLKIYNLKGELVRTEIQHTKDQITIKRNDLTNGVYLYSVHTENGNCYHGKFMVE
ncbi:MAG: T9SS type A sorting domain-containing protein [Bacteroidales bacterium]|nr:T9SS type A sorting domain-containing protein [Bacteroidales bacterium]